MKYTVTVECVGAIADLDALAQAAGISADEITLLTNDQDVQAIYDKYGKAGKRAGVIDLDSFFVVTRDGDYAAVWGFMGIIPYLDRALYQVKDQLV